MWNYAVLTKNAAAAGGPEAYVMGLFNGGRKYGRTEMYPDLALSFAGGFSVAYLISRIVEKLQKKKEAEAIAQAEENAKALKAVLSRGGEDSEACTTDIRS